MNELTSFYDLAFRQYDPTIGRFLQVDPLADVTASFSAYQYARNNPVLLNDPLGLTDNVMLQEAMCLCGGQEYAVGPGGGGRGSRYYTPWHGVSGPEIYSEYWRGYVSALEIMNYDPTNQNVEYREKAYQAIRDYAQQGAPQQENPLMRFADRAVTWEEWVKANKGLTRDEIINQMPARSGLPGGPRLRYVFDPLNSKAVIDMRHVIIVGKLGPAAGNLNEVVQLGTDPASAMDPQDFYSNSLGYKFYNYVEGRGLDGWINNNIISSPEKFVNRLDFFMTNPVYRKPIFTER